MIPEKNNSKIRDTDPFYRNVPFLFSMVMLRVSVLESIVNFSRKEKCIFTMHITVGKLQSIMELLFMPLHKKYYEDFDTGKPSILRLILGYMFLKSYLLSEVF